MDIVEWKPGYYPNIKKARTEQKKCFEKIKSEIEAGFYVDVEDNDAYLFSYGYLLNEYLLVCKRNPIDVKKNNKYLYRGFMKLNTDINKLDEVYRLFICLYYEKKPKVIKYFYPMLLFTDLYLNVSNDLIINDLNNWLEFLLNNNEYDINSSVVIIYVMVNNLKSDDYVDPRFFKIFAGARLGSYITKEVQEAYPMIISYVTNILNMDFEYNKINYLYRMYEFTEGILYGELYGICYKIKKKDKLNIEIENKETYITKAYVDNVMVPVEGREIRQIFLKTVMREAENVYRKFMGLSFVGEGWISETKLFYQIKRAFPNEEVYQHASPAFLGRQHYDIYIPKYKIALEYQGEQHFRPIEFFGGVDAFNNNKKRDKRKKEISLKNSVYLIEVLPDYKIENIISEILSYIIGENDADYEKYYKEALKKVKNVENGGIDVTKSYMVGEALNKVIGQRRNEKKEIDKLDEEIDIFIEKLILERESSDYADPEWLHKLSRYKFNKMRVEFDEVEELSKTDIEAAYMRGLKLMNYGYRAPAIYGRMAIILRKMGKVDEEIDLLLQMKRDFGYTNYDERIRRLIKNKYYSI